MNREEDILIHSLWRRQAETIGFWGRVTREAPTGPIYEVSSRDREWIYLHMWSGDGPTKIRISKAELLRQFCQYRSARWHSEPEELNWHG